MRFSAGRALDLIVFRQLLATFSAERMATGQRKRFVGVVIVWQEAYATFKDAIHVFQFNLKVIDENG